MDQEAFDRLVRTIYSSAIGTQDWESLLQLLRCGFGGSDAALLAWDAAAARPRLCATRAEPAAEYMRHWDGLNILKDPGIRLPAGTVTPDAALRPREELERSDYYNGFLLPYDMAHLLVMKLCSSVHGDTVVNVTRSFGGGDFPPSAFRLARRLIPHFQCAVAQAGRLQWSSLNAGCIDLLPIAVIMLDRGRRPIHVNPAAAALLARQDGLEIGAQGLAAGRLEDTRRLAAVVAAAVAGRGGALRVPRPSGKRAFAVLASPLDVTFDWLHRPQPAAMLSIVDPQAKAVPHARQLRELYGLTASEAALALRIARGDELREAAAALGITVLSARQYLGRVFRKTGTSRQHDLAGLLAGLGGAPGGDGVARTDRPSDADAA